MGISKESSKVRIGSEVDKLLSDGCGGVECEFFSDWFKKKNGENISSDYFLA